MYQFGDSLDNAAVSRPDVVIAGGGVIGLSIALELRRREAQVVVLERNTGMRQASMAAAGMLAAEDPHNPVELQELARYSRRLYAEYLGRVGELAGTSVPVQTRVTWQYLDDGSRVRLAEDSIDPRQLVEALGAAARAAGVELREGVSAELPMQKGVIVASGAWSGEFNLPVFPRKGQMLRVRVPEGVELTEVHRSERVYVVPRTAGPQAGTALIGATVEDAGFNVSTDASDLAELRALGAELVPELGSEERAPMVEAWAGLRPTTPDGLPLLGWLGQTLVATGHFRNGILMAPATAMVIADLVEGKTPAVNLDAFAPVRGQAVLPR